MNAGRTSESLAARPTCPFCGEAWTGAMIEQYEGMIEGDACACCGGSLPAPHEHVERRPAIPVSDLCCAHCGRAIYLAPTSITA